MTPIQRSLHGGSAAGACLRALRSAGIPALTLAASALPTGFAACPEAREPRLLMRRTMAERSCRLSAFAEKSLTVAG